MILDPNGMPILQPTVDNAETATFNTAFAAIGSAIAGLQRSMRKSFSTKVALDAFTGWQGLVGFIEETDEEYIWWGSWKPWNLNRASCADASGFSANSMYVSVRAGVAYTQGNCSPTGTGSVTGTMVQIATIPDGYRPARRAYPHSGAWTIAGSPTFHIEPNGDMSVRNLSGGDTSYYTTNSTMSPAGGWIVTE